MFGIIVTGHGGFAKGIEETLLLIMGKNENIDFINFKGGMSATELSNEISVSISKMASDKGILILADIKGGTPFNAGVILSQKINDIRIIGGCNMPMLIEALDLRDDTSLEDAVPQIIEAAKNEIGEFTIHKIIEESEDGI